MTVVWTELEFRSDQSKWLELSSEGSHLTRSCKVVTWKLKKSREQGQPQIWKNLATLIATYLVF